MDGFEDLWQTNTSANLKRFSRLPSVEIFQDKGRDKAAIICGAGPSLAKDIDALKGRDRGQTVLIAVNSALKFLYENEVPVDYAIAVDGQKKNIIDHLNPQYLDGFPVILASNCHPEVVEQCGDRVHVAVCLGGITNIIQRYRVMNRWGAPIVSGGNAFNAAAHIARHVLDARTFMFCGSDLSFSGQYYVDKSTEYDDQLLFHMENPNGEFWTGVPLYTYKLWLENFCDQHSHDCIFFNCSGGVLGYDGMDALPFIRQSGLREALDLWGEACVDFKDVATREKYKYEMAYRSDKEEYLPTTCVNLWNQLLQQGIVANYQRALDIGCGPGFGVRMARGAGLETYGCDIADLTDIWEKQGIADYCTIAPAHKMPYPDNAFDFVLCTEVLEHIPEELIDQTLSEIARVASGYCVFTVSVVLVRGAKIDGRIEPHVTVHPGKWWDQKFKKAGFEIAEKHGMKLKAKISLKSFKNQGYAYTLLAPCQQRRRF